MQKAALVLAITTVALLNVILAVGNGRSSDAVFQACIELLPFAMLPSSAFLGYLCWARGHRTTGGLFALNVTLFFVAVGLLAAGRPLDASVLFVADVLQLNLSLVALTRHWALLSGSEMQRPMLT